MWRPLPLENQHSAIRPGKFMSSAGDTIGFELQGCLRAAYPKPNGTAFSARPGAGQARQNEAKVRESCTNLVGMIAWFVHIRLGVYEED